MREKVKVEGIIIQTQKMVYNDNIKQVRRLQKKRKSIVQAIQKQ